MYIGNTEEWAAKGQSIPTMLVSSNHDAVLPDQTDLNTGIGDGTLIVTASWTSLSLKNKEQILLI